MRAAQTTWTPLAPRRGARDERRRAETARRRLRTRVGRQPRAHVLHVTADTTLQGITGLRLEALPDPSLPKAGPGRDGYGHFRVTGIQVEIAPLDPARGALSESRRAPARRRSTPDRRFQDDQGGRLRVRIRAGGAAGDWRAVAGSQRRIVGDQRDAGHGPSSATGRRSPRRRRSASPKARASRCGSIISTGPSVKASAASACRSPRPPIRSWEPTSPRVFGPCWLARVRSALRRRPPTLRRCSDRPRRC